MILSAILSVVLFIGCGDAVQLFFREEKGVVDVANQLGQQWMENRERKLTIHIVEALYTPTHITCSINYTCICAVSAEIQISESHPQMCTRTHTHIHAHMHTCTDAPTHVNADPPVWRTVQFLNVHHTHRDTSRYWTQLDISASAGSRNVQLSSISASVSTSTMNQFPSHSGIYSNFLTCSIIFLHRPVVSQ